MHQPHAPGLGSPRWKSTRTLGMSAAAVAIVLALTVLTPDQLTRLHSAVPWLERLWFPELPFDLRHVVLFAVIAAGLRLVLTHVPWYVILVGLGALALASELSQMGKPGRTPSLSDMRDDVIGAALGLWVVAMIRRLAVAEPGLSLAGRWLLLGGTALLFIGVWPASQALAWGLPHAMLGAALLCHAVVLAGRIDRAEVTGFHVALVGWVLAIGLAYLDAWSAQDLLAQSPMCSVAPPSDLAGFETWVWSAYLASLSSMAYVLASDRGLVVLFLLINVAGAAVATALAFGAQAPVVGILAVYPDLGWSLGFPSEGPYVRLQALLVSGLVLLLGMRSILAMRRSDWILPGAFAVFVLHAGLGAWSGALHATPLLWLAMGVLAGLLRRVSSVPAGAGD